MQALAAPLAFIGRRAFQALLVMLMIAVIAFAVRAALGDPLREMMGEAVPKPSGRRSATSSGSMHRGPRSSRAIWGVR